MPNQPKPKAPPDPSRPRSGKNSNSLANLKPPYQKGVSGNPSGKSRSLNDIMRLARSKSTEAVETLYEIMSNKSESSRDRIQAAIALLDRGCGRPVVPVFRGTNNNLPDDMIEGVGGDGEWTPLLGAAKAGSSYRKQLVDELARIDREERQGKAERRDEVDAAVAAQANGEVLSPMMNMLVKIRKETS